MPLSRCNPLFSLALPKLYSLSDLINNSQRSPEGSLSLSDPTIPSRLESDLVGTCQLLRVDFVERISTISTLQEVHCHIVRRKGHRK